MEIIISGEPKEIADLVLAVQGQPVTRVPNLALNAAIKCQVPRQGATSLESNLNNTEQIVKVCVKESQHRFANLIAGQKVLHKNLGEGMVVGFSNISDEPFVLFYNTETQDKYGSCIICLSHKELEVI